MSRILLTCSTQIQGLTQRTFSTQTTSHSQLPKPREMGQHSLNSSVLVIFPHCALSRCVLKLILPIWISNNSIKVVFFQTVYHSANTRLSYCYLAITILLKKGYSNEIKPKYSSNFILYDKHNSRQLCESHTVKPL